MKDSTVQELTRAIRLHFSTFLQSMKDGEKEDNNFLFTAERGLAHSYGRAKIKFNVNRSDNMIIQSISILDQLDKDVNTFAMRLREWYSWHFPELVKIVNDNILYARCALAIGNRENFDESAYACPPNPCSDPSADLFVSASLLSWQRFSVTRRRLVSWWRLRRPPWVTPSLILI